MLFVQLVTSVVIWHIFHLDLQDLKDSEKRVADLEAKLIENVPVDVGAEMKKLLKKIVWLYSLNIYHII